MGAPADNDWRSAPCPDRPLDRAALGREAERLAAAHLDAAQQLLQQRRDLARHPVRFDVIALSRRGAAAGPAASGVDAHAGDGESPWKIDWLQHAFEARG